MEIRATPHNEAGRLALQIYGRALEAVRADRLVIENVERVGENLFIQGSRIDLSLFERVLVCAAGKASLKMAVALASLLGDKMDGGVVIGKRGSGEGKELPSSVAFYETAHPVPDESSLEAGSIMLALAASCDERTLVLFALSGGASALMEALKGDIGLSDLQQTNQVLLGSGLDIRVMNQVRSKLSRIKGGGLACAFVPATVVVLVLSDVPGNDLAAIGSGPFMTPRGDLEVPFDLLSELPERVRQELLSPDLLPPTPPAKHFVIGSVSVAVHAAASAAGELGLATYAYGDPMKGDAREMARQICRVAGEHVHATPKEPLCVVFGGETTVKIQGSGKGGRCQEMAAAASQEVAKIPGSAFLAVGTDGQDGPTDAAGGLVGPESRAQATQKGIKLAHALNNNDSYRYLEACRGLVFTGPTGTNVNDLCLFVYSP